MANSRGQVSNMKSASVACAASSSLSCSGADVIISFICFFVWSRHVGALYATPLIHEPISHIGVIAHTHYASTPRTYSTFFATHRDPPHKHLGSRCDAARPPSYITQCRSSLTRPRSTLLSPCCRSRSRTPHTFFSRHTRTARCTSVRAIKQ